MSFAQVALPLPLRRTFVYRVPDSLGSTVQPGVQVEVPFRGRTRRGHVLELSGHTDVAEVRDIAAVTPAPRLTPHLMALARWVADYYLAPIGEVLAATLPGGLEGFARSRARKEAREDPVMRLPLPQRLTLTPAQRSAVEALESAISTGGFKAFLLHGVTASGKTEVYMRAARAARELGGQALVLVPEVALGSQVVREFERRFGGRVGVLHSYLGVGERRRNWELARRGALDVVVGARSAVFAPLPGLKLMVVDEEQDAAYKQSEQLRYHGRDVAVRRAQLLGIPVVLGSATPSLESLANAARGKYTRLRLPERVDRRPLPEVRVVDLRGEGVTDALLSRPLRQSLAERLEKGEPSVLFLNRRGHSHHTQCRACGWVPRCPHCDIALILHLRPSEWRCHYCDHREPARGACPQCGARLLRLSGAGTQRVERELAEVFPKARVLRLDTDVARERGRPAEILRAFANGEADVLLGTQMVAKGLDFPRVTLVGVLDADVALHLPDFRAAERTFQLLVQVAGRSGRGPARGEVFVQTCTPDHPAIEAAVRHDDAAFLERELNERREAGYPPFKRLATILFSGKDEARIEALATGVEEALASEAAEAGVEMLGPAPQALARLRGQHRWHLLLKAENAAKLHQIAARGLELAEGHEHAASVRVVADVDPVDVL
ncbi:MAG TPA: primosomal protein N' [Candidatus Sulfotelmatobacter sp.]|nr:primosomal protein N' [Candidatus Sulfotelmatobacter sp.]